MNSCLIANFYSFVPKAPCCSETKKVNKGQQNIISLSDCQNMK